MAPHRFGDVAGRDSRLLAVLESFSIPARAIIWYSPALQDHIFVDVYDPVEKKAYLLDPTFNLWSKFDDIEQGYLDVLAGMPAEERRRYLRNGLVSFRRFQAGAQYLKRKNALYAALTYELTIAMDHWKKNYPRGCHTISPTWVRASTTSARTMPCQPPHC